MKWTLPAAAALAILSTPAHPVQGSLLHDPVSLNIGVSCQWQTGCMSRQRSAMKRALGYVAKKKPPQWRVQLCNRNASRGGYRVDWIGFDHCVRNESLRPPPPRSVKKRSKR
jgi:hypothetical protein